MMRACMSGWAEQKSATRLMLFTLGFRPFFLLAGALPIVIMPLWLMFWLGRWSPPTYYDPVSWHAHEMLYGYAGAVIAGFLLTAVRNWTGRPTLSGGPLAGLAGLWLFARLLPLFPTVSPDALIALVDLSFIPALMIAVGIPLLRHGKWQNTALLLILAFMVCGNGLVHVAMLTGDPALGRKGLYLGLYAVVLLIVILGGRVIPFFIGSALPGAAPTHRASIEILSIAAFIATAAAQICDAPAPLTGVLAATAALSHATRLAGWYVAGLWREPLLWILYLAYAWLVLGLGLTAAATFGPLTPSLAVHALSAGAVSVMTFGMMARVALGHSGRALRAAPLTVAMFYLINLAAFSRVAGPWLLPDYAIFAIALSGVLFTLSACCFIWVYGPILVRPRIDGKPG
jgi:uncharacterized protein involved in response to NO